MINQLKKLTAYKARIFNPLSLYETEFYKDGLLIFDEFGKILFCGDSLNSPISEENFKLKDYSNKIIIPGLIDTHIHLPQFSAMGLGSGQLLDWLEQYIFPLESKFSNDEFAYQQSGVFFDAILKSGTTTASIYSSLYQSATDIAFQVAHSKGIRAYIGPVLMDLPNKNNYFESKNENILKIMNLINKWHSNSNKLKFVITPRFAGSCSLNLMESSAKIARKFGLNIQTHLAENKDELDFIKNLYPQFDNYTEIYEKTGLLTDKTILAHCIYLGDDELELIRSSGSTICHCATSNRYLTSGVMPLMTYLKSDLNICLGTDIAGSYSYSVINEMKEAIETTKTYNILNGANNTLEPESALYLATLAGAKALKNDTIGNFSTGKYADFLVIEPNFDIEHLSSMEILSKIIYSTNSNNIKEVFIGGEKII